MDLEKRLVSGAPCDIYALAGSLFEFHPTVMNADGAEAAGIRCLFVLYGAAYYRHSANLDMLVDRDHPWSRELLKRYNREKHCHAAASVVLQINDAIISDNIIHCRAGDELCVLYESYRFPDRTVSVPLEKWPRELPVADFQVDDRVCLYLGSSGSFNYGHWLVDDLPRAKAWLELRQRMGITCLIVMPSHGAKMNEVRLRSLRMLIDREVEVQFVASDRPFRLRNLHYVTPVSFHPRVKNPAAIHFVRSQALACIPAAREEPWRRLFIARRPPNTRSIVNFNELWSFLAARGFEMIEAEALDFAEQTALFRDARVVVGQMGAAMTNTLFCRPATPLVYLAPIGWTEPFYLDLAAVGGQQYDVLAGAPTSDGPIHLSDFNVSVDHLYHRLTYMGFTEDLLPQV